MSRISLAWVLVLVATGCSSSSTNSAETGGGGGAGGSGGASGGAAGSGTGGANCTAPATTDHVETSAEGHCYRWSSVLTNFDAAEGDCVKWGGHLVAITSKPEQTFLAQFMDKVRAASPAVGQVYIGARAAKAGTFTWMNGEQMIFEGWDPSQPDEITFPACARSVFALSWFWADGPCDSDLSYVCER